ncbi:MAG: AMP-binding protein [Opitutus sp.]
MTIGEILTQQAQLRPDAVALIDDQANRRLTFAELENAVAHAAQWWIDLGLARGQAVLVFVPMSADLYVALLALFRIGAVAMFLDPSAGEQHVQRCCERFPPRAFLGPWKAHLLRLKFRALRDVPLHVTLNGWMPGARRWPTRWSSRMLKNNLAEPRDAALVTFTSGSTGVPKGAVRTHAFLLAQNRALAPSLALEAGEVDLATLPVFVLASLAAGITSVIAKVSVQRPGAVDARELFAAILRHGVTRMTASPALFERLIAHSHATGRRLPSLTKLYTGGAPVFPRVLEQLRQMAPNAQVVAVYGSTEAEPIAHIDARKIATADLDAMKRGRGLLAGLPVPEIRLAILNDQWGQPRAPLSVPAFEAATLRSGEVGEIVVTGDHVLPGYLGGVGDEETKFKVGDIIWHRTGDAGYLDENGRLWLQGRCSARIKDAGGSLYPFGVECVAMTFPEVKRAAALSYQGKRLLVIATEGGDRLTERLLEVTRWAKIESVLLWADLPMDKRHNAKVDYPLLTKRLTTNDSVTCWSKRS